MINISYLDPFPHGNPFLSDHYHMGTRLGTNIVVMYPNHSDKECPYVIVCNNETGERIKLEFKEDQSAAHLADLFNNIVDTAEPENK